MIGLVFAAAALDALGDLLGVLWHRADQRGQRGRRAAWGALQQCAGALALLCVVESPWALLGSVGASFLVGWFAPVADPGAHYEITFTPESR